MKTTAFGLLNPTADPFMTVSYFPQGNPSKIVYLKRADLAQPEKDIYDNFEALFTQHAVVTINNTVSNIDIDFTSTATLIPAPEYVVDYNTMSVSDKAAVDAFINLVAITPGS